MSRSPCCLLFAGAAIVPAQAGELSPFACGVKPASRQAWRPRPGSLAALALEQLHQQRIVPAATVDITLGFTHHTNPPEADLLVSPDRGRVGHGGVDRDAVMTALVEQQADNLRDGLGTDATAVQLRVDEHVDACVTELGVVLLPVLNETRDHAIHLDREARRGRLVPREVLLRRVPPAPYLGSVVDTQQLCLITLGERAKCHHVTPHLPARQLQHLDAIAIGCVRKKHTNGSRNARAGAREPAGSRICHAWLVPSVNVESVQAMYDAWERDERPGPAELLDPEIEYVNPTGAVEPGTRRGLADFVRAVEKTYEGWDVRKMQLERLKEAGDRGGALVHYTARGRGSGVELEGRFATHPL